MSGEKIVAFWSVGRRTLEIARVARCGADFALGIQCPKRALTSCFGSPPGNPAVSHHHLALSDLEVTISSMRGIIINDSNGNKFMSIDIMYDYLISSAPELA